jgi:hypothetical protein
MMIFAKFPRSKDGDFSHARTGVDTSKRITEHELKEGMCVCICVCLVGGGAFTVKHYNLSPQETHNEEEEKFIHISQNPKKLSPPFWGCFSHETGTRKDRNNKEPNRTGTRKDTIKNHNFE